MPRPDIDRREIPVPPLRQSSDRVPPWLRKWSRRVFGLALLAYFRKGKKMKPRDVIEPVVKDVIDENL
jgi:hypothetical protein